MSMNQIPYESLGQRSYDIAMGFRNIDPNSALLLDYKSTHVAGMATQLASAIKGTDIVESVRALQEIAAEVMGIGPYVFDEVLRELAEVDLIRNVQYSGGSVSSFYEQVPLSYEDTHRRIGESLAAKSRTEYEEHLIVTTNVLSSGPAYLDDLTDLGIDYSEGSRFKAIADNSELVRSHPLVDGTQLVTSPLFAFEQPQKLIDLFKDHDVDEVREAVSRILEHPGTHVAFDENDPIIVDMIQLGLVQAPMVTGADSVKRAFVTIPYGLDQGFLTSQKQVLEKALAIVACVRCGQVSGGVTAIQDPERLLRALMDPERNYTLAGHSSTQRQYAPLIRLGVVRAVPRDGRLAPQLIVSEGNQDNLAAVDLARKIISNRGEANSERGNEAEAAKLLLSGQEYMSSWETLGSARRVRAGLTSEQLNDAWIRLKEW